ncbi:response regulator transcription factor [Lactobacillus sp. W8089]|nr:response regulator transcription factor [Lactobacillus sp. W8086]MBI0108150.1 response regulator transcription factor [Lactobacillus sp. W8085]MBI0111368.1 response regulator transcription factor [Lactobacillus sp. W8088]MBI0115083.1 response regulator transcription factor [Lactobacillus sp. W8087]MBI0118808.1 response regulator transcription factor [Lactobacillus sp. W8089]MBI0130773.1 response regulator transcription factor [Lactobacillus sp. W8090]
MTKILLIEDNSDILQAMQERLTKWQYQSFTIENWQQVTQSVVKIEPDLIVMDITLPVFDGFYWTKQIRSFSEVPILFVSAAQMDPNAVRAIASGADDYLVKPFSLDVFISKIQAILRRTQREIKEELLFQNYHLNILTNEVSYQQRTVKLTPTEGLILKLFFLQPDQTLSKEDLRQKIWQSGKFLDDAILNVNMSRLRNKITPLHLQEHLITERGRGYRLVSS